MLRLDPPVDAISGYIGRGICRATVPCTSAWGFEIVLGRSGSWPARRSIAVAILSAVSACAPAQVPLRSPNSAPLVVFRVAALEGEADFGPAGERTVAAKGLALGGKPNRAGGSAARIRTLVGHGLPVATDSVLVKVGGVACPVVETDGLGTAITFVVAAGATTGDVEFLYGPWINRSLFLVVK